MSLSFVNLCLNYYQQQVSNKSGQLQQKTGKVVKFSNSIIIINNEYERGILKDSLLLKQWLNEVHYFLNTFYGL